VRIQVKDFSNIFAHSTAKKAGSGRENKISKTKKLPELSHFMETIQIFLNLSIIK
jgi:hypothetical protein